MAGMKNTMHDQHSVHESVMERLFTMQKAIDSVPELTKKRGTSLTIDLNLLLDYMVLRHCIYNFPVT
jgi:hypothetical protein